MLLLGNPPLGAFEVTAATGFGLAALAEKAGMGAVRRGTTVAAHAHGAIRKGQYQYPAGERLSPAEQFYWLTA